MANLEMLRFCRFHHPDSAPTLPSWVFDFSIPFQLNNSIVAYASGRSKQESSYDAAQASLTVHGRTICFVDHVFEAVPIDAKLSEVFRICRAWEEIVSSEASKTMGGSWWDAFISAIFSSLIGGGAKVGRDLSLSDLKSIYGAACERGSFHIEIFGEFPTQFIQAVINIQTSPPGRRLFTANDGFIGLCAFWAQKGDVVVVALGCQAPLVLRPAAGGQYQVGGECYVYGMMNGEGLLGLIDSDGHHAWQQTVGILVPVVVDGSGIPTQLDPRAGLIPSGWQVAYGEWSDVSRGIHVLEKLDREFEDGRLKEQWFYHAQGEEWSEDDPRLTSEKLRKIGVEIQDFVLV